MGARRFIIFSIVPLAVMLWVSQAMSGQTDATVRKAAYANLLDRCIARCDEKSALRNSRSEKLRQTAAMACLKSAYLKNYREKIIQEMMISNVRPCQYKVQYFINSMFYKILRPEITVSNSRFVYVR